MKRNISIIQLCEKNAFLSFADLKRDDDCKIFLCFNHSFRLFLNCFWWNKIENVLFVLLNNGDITFLQKKIRKKNPKNILQT